MKSVGKFRWWGYGSVIGVLSLVPVASAELSSAHNDPNQITFTNISLDSDSGIDYRRAASPILQAVYDAVKIKPFLSLQELYSASFRRASPGVAVLDFNGNGYMDIFVTNGPGRANSLYKNLLPETGELRFADVGIAAGVGAADMDAVGVCYGDINNSGHSDLLVLGRMENNRLFLNNGDGTFTHAVNSGLEGGAQGHTACAMGDINGNGLLDVFVGNSFDWYHREAIHSDLYSYNHPNDLYLNQGNASFVNVSEESGIRNLFNVPEGDATITWAVAMVDINGNGHLDIIHGDDNGGLPPSSFAGVDRGYIQLFQNDGAGNFTNVTGQSGATAHASAWMGVAFGDLNCDGHLDFFMTNVGDYFFPHLGLPTPPGLDSSRWSLALGGDSGIFTFPDLGELLVTPFGWGAGIADYDNDGDADIIYFGGMDTVPFQLADNPGVILKNHDCTAEFTWDRLATIGNAERTQRQEVLGLALGDLNNNGFVDIVTVSSQYVPETIPLVPMNVRWGSVFDAVAAFLPIFTPIGPMEWEWSGREVEEGFLDVMLNSASNGNNWVKIRTMGTVGLTSQGAVNRDGIGAVVQFTPQGGKTSMSPVLGGSSHMSQHSLVQGFGLGQATRGTVDILWPGGTRNRLYDMQASETLTIPEIPCSFSAPWPNRRAYRACVDNALAELVENGTIDASFAERLEKSALKAFNDQ
jgi:enediyne biosynthesis protein E4